MYRQGCYMFVYSSGYLLMHLKRVEIHICKYPVIFKPMNETKVHAQCTHCVMDSTSSIYTMVYTITNHYIFNELRSLSKIYKSAQVYKKGKSIQKSEVFIEIIRVKSQDSLGFFNS